MQLQPVLKVFLIERLMFIIYNTQ